MNKFLLKKLSAFSALLLIFNPLQSQDFTWIKGTNLVDKPGIYGTAGVAAPTNNPGGRDGAVTWTDAAGNFWLYGGTGFDYIGNYGNLSDLWKYSPATNQWTYMKGSDIISQLALYSPAGVSTPTGMPGARHSGAAWTDGAGNLWLMGGYGYASTAAIGYLNDLWKYNIASNEWTYVGGGITCFTPGSYGTMSTPSSTNMPGSRIGAVTWTTTAAAGELWLLGGYGTSTSSLTIGSMNDMWRYTIATNEWTWIKGSNFIDQNGVYGTLSVANAANNPGGRSLATSWTDASGNFWMHGGEGWDATATSGTGLLNDLWKYDAGANEWAWIKGSDMADQIGVYGLQGTGSSANAPGGRSGAVSYQDAVGNFWLFAGKGYPGSTSATSGELNDLWKYNLANNEWTWVRGSAVLNQSGTYGTQGVGAFANIPGARTTPAGWIDSSNDLYFFGGHGQAANGPAGDLNDLWKYTNCFISPITMTIISQDSAICAGETTSLTVSGSDNYLWSNNLTTTPYQVISPSSTTTYSVYTADSKGCRYTAAFTETVSACTGIHESVQSELQHALYPNPNNGAFTLVIPGFGENTSLLIFNTLGQPVLNQSLPAGKTSVRTDLAKGIYYYTLKSGKQTGASGKFIIE